jgi:hypothetical protein
VRACFMLASVSTPSSLIRERERGREKERERERESEKEGEREREMLNMSRIVVFILKGMMGALAPFSYLV